MANEQAQAVPDPTAAPTTPADFQPARNAGNDGTAGVHFDAGNAPTETVEPSFAGDPAAAADFDRLLAGATSPDDILRLTETLKPGTPQRGESLSGVPEKDYPEGATPSEHPEDIAALEPGKPLPDRLRIKGLSDERKRAILALSDPNRNFEETLRTLVPAASSPAPAGTPPAPPAPGGPPAAVPGPPAVAPGNVDPVAIQPPTETAAGIRTQIEALRQQRYAAVGAFDMGRASQLERQIDQLTDRLPQVQQAQQSYEAQYFRAFDASAEQAAALYPDVGDPNSPLCREMKRLDDQYQRANSPIVSDPNKPMLLATVAAAALRIAPNGQATARPAVPTARPAPLTAATPRAAVPGVHVPAPAAGGARTAAPNPGIAQEQLSQVLNSVKDANDIMALTRGL